MLYNGVDTTQFHPPTQEQRAAARQEFGIPDNALLVGMLGRLSPEKGGVDLLLKAFYRLSEHHPEHPPPDRRRRPLAIQLGSTQRELATTIDSSLRHVVLRPVVRFAGSRQDVPRLLGAMDLFVLPSLNEALPIVLLEAMAVGLPVLATRVGGVPEIVEDGSNGLLVSPGDEDALLAALTRLANNPALRSRLAQAQAWSGCAAGSPSSKWSAAPRPSTKSYTPSKQASDAQPNSHPHSSLVTRHNSSLPP